MKTNLKALQMWRSVILGVFVHVLMLYSVFDIYFVSPIYHGMTPHRPNIPPLARRVVLFVADGLRASSLYEDRIKQHAPYLSNVIDSLGSWGISHTQVPTESRPGHIALLAGFNEDPSAITRGWQSNPVDFDSVINQSMNAWCWGSPDIVNMFNKENLPHIHLYSYDATMQDFSGKHNATTALDIWVFNKVKTFVHTQNRAACTDFCQNGNILFLHLLGLDTAGHSLKPGSAAYIENIKVVDSGVKDIVELIDQYFNDGMTAYVFTADHGMTNWGSHGDGSEHETKVPFIAWGAGILQNPIALDIEQINIAVLLSSLIGINVPINSLGVVPLDIFNTTDVHKAQIIYANARQLMEQFMKKHTILQTNTMKLTFRPYSNFSELRLNFRLLENLIKKGYSAESIKKAHEIIGMCKEGIKYYLGYYQNMLLFFVTFGFIGWIIYLFISIVKLKILVENIECTLILSRRDGKLLKVMSFIVYVLLALICVVMFAQSLPMKYYLYCVFCFTWLAVGENLKVIFAFLSVVNRSNWLMYAYSMIGYVIGIEILVTTFFARDYISILLLFYFWKCYNDRHIYRDFYDWLIDLITILVLAACPIVLQLQTRFSYRSLFLSLLLWTDSNYNIMRRLLSAKDKIIFGVQFGFLYLAFVNAIAVNLTITYGYGLLMINQIISWISLVVSPILPLLMSTKPNNRLLSATVALMTPYTLMAVGYEHLFMHFFVRLILNWSSKESVRKLKKTLSTVNDIPDGHTDDRSVKNCFYLLVFLMFSYFGVGNTASVSSFDPMWTRCFVTIFSPFMMSGLILIKLMIPFLIVLCGFRSVIASINGQLYNCFLTLLLFCDLMVIHFLYFVKNEGSWLEIGVSLSRYIAVNVTTILLIILYQIANVLTTVKGTTLKTVIVNVSNYIKVKLN